MCRVQRAVLCRRDYDCTRRRLQEPRHVTAYRHVYRDVRGLAL